jgi:Domain of unknown function (DUF4160)
MSSFSINKVSRTNWRKKKSPRACQPTARRQPASTARFLFSAKVPQHVPRIKVAVDPPTHLERFGNNASVAIDDGSVFAGDLPTRVHKQVRRFIELNRDVLLDYWEQRIDDDELKARLKKID